MSKTKTVFNSMKIFKIFILLIFPFYVSAQEKFYVFENLGKPIRTSIPVEIVTNDSETGPIAWAGLTDATRSALVGIHVDNGKLIEVDLTPYGKANGVLLFKHNEHIIYIYAGNKGRFFKYDIRLNQLTPLGEISNSTYWMKSSHTVSPDGKIYVGTYPGAAVSVLDPLTEEVIHMNHISSSEGAEYVINPVASVDGIIYFPIGMHHGELWSFDSKTKERKQILPKELESYGPPIIWRAEDGDVYGKKGNTVFRCTPNEIIEGETKPIEDSKPENVVNGKVALLIDRDGSLVLEDQKSKQRTSVKSKFDAPAKEIFSIGDVHDGKLYGSTIKPGPVFSFDMNTGKLEDLGMLTRGTIQVYDILSHGKGMFMSSYTGGYIDYYEPNEPKSDHNPRPVAHLHETDNQERPVQLTLGPDGVIYSPTVPLKGHLGGVIAQIDPNDFTTTTYHDLIHNQSFTSVTAVPETGELFITSSIAGGSSSVPTEKEAYVFLWDTKTKKISYKAKPIDKTTGYSTAVRAPNGIIYGFSGNQYYAFDPVKRKIVFKGIVSGREKPSARNIVVSEKPGPGGLLYAVDNVAGNIISIDPENHRVSIIAHDSTLVNARVAEVQSDGYLYYSHHASLMRVKVTAMK